jgi:hypothetical protein
MLHCTGMLTCCTTGSFNGWQGQDMNDNSDDVCDDVAYGESLKSVTASIVTADTEITAANATAVTSKVPAHVLHLLLPPGYYRYYYISDGVRTVSSTSTTSLIQAVTLVSVISGGSFSVACR